MSFARWVFRLAGVYGVVLLGPSYFLERVIDAKTVEITHPEYFYGFVGTALTWQIVFLMISRDPVRFRPVMIAGIVEKLAFGIPAWVLWSDARVGNDVVALGTVDLLWAILFTIAYIVSARLTATELRRPPAA